MINSIISIIIITLILGPLAFFIISRKASKKYPTGISDSLGDIVALPLFNGSLFYLGVHFNLRLLIAVASTVIILAIYLFIDLKSDYSDWSKKKNKYTSKGYYHLFFFFGQTILICYGFISYYSEYIIIIPLALYLSTVLFQMWYYKHW